MHDTDINPAQQPATIRDDALAIPQTGSRTARSASAGPQAARRVGLLQRVLTFFLRLFKPQRAAHMPAPLTAAERAAAARAAQMSPPVAFKGDTANTLVTPMGAYAGKPVDQAMRKRAEQQFKNMDVTRTTMN
jgi:hypothetical protein